MENENTISVSLSGLRLGDISLLDADDLFDGGEQSALRYPLTVKSAQGKAQLRYRDPTHLVESGQGTYEINLGAVIAASAIVFSSSSAAKPAIISMLLLVQDESRRADPDEGLRAILVDTAEDGETARPAPPARLEKLLTEIAENGGATLSPLLQSDAVDMRVLLRHAVTEQPPLTLDVDLAILDDLSAVFDLPETATFDADGVLYFRELLQNDEFLLPDRLHIHDDLYVVAQVVGGGLVLLEDVQGEVGIGVVAEETLSSRNLEHGIEDFLTRLVVIADDPDIADAPDTTTVEFTLYGDNDMITSERIAILPTEQGDGSEVVEGEGILAYGDLVADDNTPIQADPIYGNLESFVDLIEPEDITFPVLPDII